MTNTRLNKLCIFIKNYINDLITRNTGKWHLYLHKSAASGNDACVRESTHRPPLLSARPVVTLTAKLHHCPVASIKLYCLVTEAHRCQQLASFTRFCRHRDLEPVNPVFTALYSLTNQLGDIFLIQTTTQAKLLYTSVTGNKSRQALFSSYTTSLSSAAATYSSLLQSPA